MSVRQLLFAASLLFCSALPAQQPAVASPPPLLLGTAWYPEQWPEARWDADLILMQQAGMHVVRVGEFAWSTMEPSEGRFDFTWLDHAIAMAAKHDIYVVLGTPSAAPPAWLTQKYPETLRTEENGRRDEHGNRQQFSANDPKYRELAVRIAHEMAVHYGHNPHVLGWQIDNEIGAPDFGPAAVQQWHQWLAKKYGTVANLNEHWSTAYWSQTYDSFEEVPFHSRDENPGLLLDYKHFVTDTWTSYVDAQVDAIRSASTPAQFITTNTMHWYSVFDHYQIHRSLDLAAWDDYVPDGKLDPALNGILHDLVRGYKQKNFWVMETQPAFVNWGPVNAALPPGVTRQMAWQAVAHGADAVLYWQWRSALGGQEQYHGTVVGADGLPVPIYDEIAHIGRDFAAAGPALAGTEPHAEVAILQDYDSHWAIDFQRHNQHFDYTAALTDYYRALRPIAQSVDVISPEAELARYKIVFAPALNVLPEPLAQHLLRYVQAGGTLVLGDRSGMKDSYNALNPERQPGPLAAALGAHVGEFYALEQPVPLTGPAGSGTGSLWAETLVPTAPDTRTLLTYAQGNGLDDGWLAGKPAAVARTVGKGTLIYLGSNLDPALMKTVTASLLQKVGVQPILPGVPPEIEVSERSAPGKAPVLILINQSDSVQSLTLPTPERDLLTQAAASSTLTLSPHGIAVLTP